MKKKKESEKFNQPFRFFCQLLYSSAKSLFFIFFCCCRVSVYTYYDAFSKICFSHGCVDDNPDKLFTVRMQWNNMNSGLFNKRKSRRKNSFVLISSGFNVCKMCAKRLMCIKWKMKFPLLKSPRKYPFENYGLEFPGPN